MRFSQIRKSEKIRSARGINHNIFVCKIYIILFIQENKLTGEDIHNIETLSIQQNPAAIMQQGFAI